GARRVGAEGRRSKGERWRGGASRVVPGARVARVGHRPCDRKRTAARWTDRIRDPNLRAVPLTAHPRRTGLPPGTPLVRPLPPRDPRHDALLPGRTAAGGSLRVGLLSRE